MIPYLVVFWGLLYFGFVLWLIRGWQGTVATFDELEVPPVQELLLADRLPTITVVVPVRDEVAHLPSFIGSLLGQDYPAHLWQAVLVDDKSTDGSQELMQRLAANVPGQLRVISVADDLEKLESQVDVGQELPDVLDHASKVSPSIALSLIPSPKKRAILAAIISTKSDVILTTDADCQLPRGWLSGYGRLFASGPWQAISGPVRMATTNASHTKTGLWAELQTMEFGSLVVTGAATLAYDWPTLCNGANLAYRRKAFHAVGGFAGVEHQPSGDDEFLWHKLGNAFHGTLLFAATSAMAVTTSPAPSWSQFMHQRIRWASKWDQYQSKAYTALAAGLGIWHLMTLLLMVLTCFGIVSWASLALLLCNKLLADYLLLSPAYGRLGIPFSMRAFVIVGIGYPFYAAFFALRTLLSPKYEWKGRQFGASGS